MRSMLKRVRELTNRQSFVIDKSMRYLRRGRHWDVLEGEYIRTSTLELLAWEIHDKKIKGAVAELGVYKGDFAKLINRAFPDRKLYLFDTFAGFDSRDVKFDQSSGYSEGDQHFEDTSIELVLSKMKHRENVIVRKGWFPESAGDTSAFDEEFCFVSLDTDLYDPIIEGLKFFWPRLSAGGYIMVHDYNNDAYRGVKDAVREFCRDQGARYTPVTESCGSVVVSKPGA